MNKILKEDMDYIYNKLNENNKFYNNSSILITGCAGFLGYYFMNYFNTYFEELKLKKIVGVDNFIISHPKWVDEIQKENSNIQIDSFDIVKDDIKKIDSIEDIDIVIHLASIASPVFYRQYPLETIDANVTGLRTIFDYYKNKKIKGILYFSSSEIYGNPDEKNIPTNEEYQGLVSCTGPRACYDESKRFCETLCTIYHEKHSLPIRVVRPFNNYGPGISINDKRVVADFAKAAYNNENIRIFSDGGPTRTFCYISDAIVGYLKVLTYHEYDYFNIGIDTPEITIDNLAQIYKKCAKNIFNHDIDVVYETHTEKEYLTDNPNRRCPDITKAKSLLNYTPTITVEKGVTKYLTFLKENKGIL